MTRVVRNAALLCVAGILVASAALANVPDPAKSTLSSSFIDVEGSTAGNPDNCSDGRCGNLTVTVRDFANNAIAGSTVVIDFSGCSDISISCNQLNSVTGQTYLAGKKVSGTTNSLGQFVFKVQGGGTPGVVVPPNTVAHTTAAGTNVGVACAQMYADGVPLVPTLKVAVYDVNGLGTPNAMSTADVSLVSAENGQMPFGAQGRARDDYDHSGTISVVDVSRESQMNGQAALGTGTQVTSPFCP